MDPVPGRSSEYKAFVSQQHNEGFQLIRQIWIQQIHPTIPPPSRGIYLTTYAQTTQWECGLACVVHSVLLFRYPSVILNDLRSRKSHALISEVSVNVVQRIELYTGTKILPPLPKTDRSKSSSSSSEPQIEQGILELSIKKGKTPSGISLSPQPPRFRVSSISSMLDAPRSRQSSISSMLDTPRFSPLSPTPRPKSHKKREQPDHGATGYREGSAKTLLQAALSSQLTPPT
ncbi:hypothetical protein EV127DRAFT_407098 [Xylaria flabelliformis]|nr:hypothetical protein EV127DRAFT_407098 [Xylaria flabelliformis]